MCMVVAIVARGVPPTRVENDAAMGTEAPANGADGITRGGLGGKSHIEREKVDSI